jgi:hypothetical protein
VARADSFEKRRFLPTRIRKFQLRRARFAGNSWLIRLELTPLNAENKPGPPAMAVRDRECSTLPSMGERLGLGLAEPGLQHGGQSGCI